MITHCDYNLIKSWTAVSIHYQTSFLEDTHSHEICEDFTENNNNKNQN